MWIRWVGVYFARATETRSIQAVPCRRAAPSRHGLLEGLPVLHGMVLPGPPRMGLFGVGLPLSPLLDWDWRWNLRHWWNHSAVCLKYYDHVLAYYDHM